MALVDCDTP